MSGRGRRAGWRVPASPITGSPADRAGTESLTRWKTGGEARGPAALEEGCAVRDPGACVASAGVAGGAGSSASAIATAGAGSSAGTSLAGLGGQPLDTTPSRRRAGPIEARCRAGAP
jgi:hypothetical protein